MRVTVNTTPGRCFTAPLLVAILIGAAFVASLFSPRDAAAQKKKAAAATKKFDGGERGTDGSKVYSFTGLDIDGRLKTPQLLYFLSRVRSEFDSVTPEHRSFLPELERSPEGM